MRPIHAIGHAGRPPAYAITTRTMLRLAVALVLVLGPSLAGAPPANGAPQQVTLLHVNDTHSHLDAWGSKDRNLDGTLGGLAKAATIIAREKAA